MESLAFWLPLKDYQMEYSSEQELHKVIAEVADTLHGLTNYSGEDEEAAAIVAKYQALAKYGSDVMNKYIDVSTLSETALRALIIENGFKFVLDYLPLTKTHLQQIVYYLPLIKAMKGTLPGLEVLLRTFATNIKIVEWWEDGSQKYTFKIKGMSFTDMGITYDVTSAIRNVCAEYVYPLLGSIDFDLIFLDSTTNKIFTYASIENSITIQFEF